MAKTTQFSELQAFISQYAQPGDDEEKGARIPAAGNKDAGTRIARPAGTGKAPGTASIISDIEERQEAGGLVGRSPSLPSTSQDFVASSDLNMLQLLAEQQGMTYIDLGKVHVEEEAIKLFPAEFARDNKVLPIRVREDGVLVVAIADPLNVTIVDNLRLLLEREIEPVVAPEDDITDLIDTHFSHSEAIDEIMDQLTADAGIATSSSGKEFHLDDPEEAAHAAPVIRLVNLVLMRALKDRASDLHIEPFQNSLRIRYRVDGVLRELPPPPKSFQIGMITRFKVMAQMNIAETRRPQDGRIKLTTQGREIDLRVSCLPTIHGESVVMRILDKQMMMIGIEQIGMTKRVLEQFRKICRRPNGVVLVTGPTGSGKTTTLYAAVMDRLDPHEKFITTEDPVEYEVPGLVQVNINAKVGLTFGACLRAILRQDPDVILVGEIRDVETATISIQAALTGHIVFSTLHTNSAAATITRLIDMGIEPFLLTSTLQVVIGQRLVRSICQGCREVYEPEAAELMEFGLKPEDVAGITFYHGAGCDECGFSGYRGRLGLFEMIAVEDEMRELILERATTDEVQELAVKQGMMTMRQDAFLKVCMGITTFHEVSHHLMADVPERTRKEILPLVKQIRERLGNDGEISESLAEEVEAPTPPPAPTESTVMGLMKNVESLPGDSQFGALPGLSSIPRVEDPPAPEAAARPASLPKLPAPPPLGDDDEFGFLSTSAIEKQTPFAEAPDMGSNQQLEELAGFDDDLLKGIDLPDIDPQKH